ncbi:uncharacterized protein LOC112126412 isoform X2 [Cimex lectularius]|uniref:TNFR-Cys domain-containing protein n=1 Tax=Cimex lectularius TaxID=79782 RepID=A0A8I6SFR4_CIMLE|nr:uncharacterized protein LOC112126412 isoform X2 [Cimex lectularius]
MSRVKIFPILCFIALMKVVMISGEELKCSSNLDCPKGTYCYKESALYKCALCSNCIRFFRKNSTIDDCPQKPEQCGECIAGYHSPKLVDGSEPSTCILINAEILQPMGYTNQKSLPPNVSTGKGFVNLHLWVAIFGVTSIVALAVAAYYARRKCNRCNTKGSNEIISEPDRYCISPSAPPPPYQNAPELTNHRIEHETKPIRSTLPFSSDIEINTTGGVRHQIDCEFDKRQKANCYKFPYYVNEGSLAPEQGEQTMAVPREEEHLPETFDDTTQPSTWRPVADCRHLNKARRKEYYWGELNTKILSTDIDENEQLEESENPAGNSGCEERQFAMFSAERSNFSSSPETTSTSNIITNFSRPTYKKHRTANSEINGFNLNICINNANANVNENNNNI